MVRLGVLHDRLNPTVAAALEGVRARGIVVDLLGRESVPREVTGARPEHDLYYLKTTSEPLLTFAGALHLAGARTLNPYATVALLGDKALAAAALEQAGVRVPQTWAMSEADECVDLLGGGPLVLKPRRGSRGRGVTIARRAEDLASWAGGPLVAQRYHPGDGADRKLYCIGDRVLGVRRPWPCVTWEAKARTSVPFEPDARLRDLVLRCRHALGIDLFGIDVVVSDGAPFVVDVNKCAGFLGVPDAASLLCEYLADACAGARG